jgi:chromosome segregation ATPase
MRHVLASEISRRETAEAENLRLREEIYRLRAQEGPTISRTSTRGSDREHSQSRADRNLVAQIGQVRHENEELRREVSAQTSMLTSRNREKERLYAEIEDLKLTMRGGGSGAAFESASRAPSVFSDRLLDRSVSRAGGAASVAGTNVTALTETEREDFENTNGALRDRISELRIKNQDLEQQLDTCYAELDQRQAMMHQLEDEVELAHAEVQEMQAERNDALRMREEMELDFEQLKDEAEEELRRLEEEIDLRGSEILRLEEEARLKEEDFRGLQQEMRNVSDVVVRLEDQQEGHQGETRRYEEKIQELQQTIQGNEQEMNVLENTLRESTEKIERLSVQGESAKSEIVFLREEQDGDKIRIGELESTIKYLEMAVVEEKEKVRETRQQVEAERKEREQHGDIKQQEWERRLNEKSGEVTKYKDEIRRLRGKVTNREDEAKTWRERLEDLERSLREALGDLSGTRAGLMKVSVLDCLFQMDRSCAN